MPSLVSLEILEPESCDGCGQCCEGIGSPVALYATRPGFEANHPFRPGALPHDLIREIAEHFAGLFRGQEPQERCLSFDAGERRCRNFEWQPQVWRDYEPGGSACLALRRYRLRTSPNGTSSEFSTGPTTSLSSSVSGGSSSCS